MTKQRLRVDVRNDGEDMADGVGAIGITQACADEGLGDGGEFAGVDCVDS